MKWLATFLIIVYLGNSRGSLLNNPMLLAFKDEISEASILSNTLTTSDVTSKVFFYLYTKQNTNKGQEIILNDGLSLEASFYNPERPTKVIVHGFMDDSHDTKLQKLKGKFLELEDVNVIMVDWGKIAKSIFYYGVAEKTVNVGAYLGEFIDFLSQNGADLEDFHLIGHSLGAHVSGFAGAHLNGKVGRITGLDPAWPGFEHASADQRLDRSNAKFVDCIHTCAGLLSFSEAICSADFYPNGGQNIQPGCPIYDIEGKCSHFRAVDYFIESTNATHIFPTEKCPSPPLNTYWIRRCTSSSVEMGYYVSTSVSGIFYGKTKSKYPFGVVEETTS